MTKKTRNGEAAQKKLHKLLAEIKRNTVLFPIPSENFDPRKADSDELRYFGLPPRPDRLTQPEQYAFWWQLFSPPLRFINAAFSFQSPSYGLSPLQPLPAIATRYETSSNWSGAYISPKHGRMFIEVHGSWQVPTPSPPVSLASGVPADGDYRSSTWIGLDGQRRYLNSSLPQIGTAQFVKVVNGQPTTATTAWWQWWLRGQINPPITLSLVVKPSDLVMCSLIVTGRTSVRFYIKNQTTGDFVQPFEEPPPPSPVPLKVSGATAEWVMERPTYLDGSGRLYELPNYGTVLFSNCFAVAASAPGLAGRNQKLPGAKLINMFAVREHPHRTVDISVAEREGDQEIATFYR